jgi:hypothetical protein
MSIATEIQRLQGAKANIKNAIEQKGVTVGDGTIDTYAEKISEISGGGGGLKYSSGTVEFARNDVHIILYHNLGSVPRMVFIRTELTENTPVSTIGLSYNNVFTEPLCVLAEYRTVGSSPTNVIATTSIKEITEEYIKFTYRNATYKFLAGVPYNWLAIE